MRQSILYKVGILNLEIHVPLGVDLPIWMGTFKVSNRREEYIYIIFIYKYLFKVLLKSQWNFVVLLSLLSTRNFRFACISVEMLKGYMVKRMLATPVMCNTNFSSNAIPLILLSIGFIALKSWIYTALHRPVKTWNRAFFVFNSGQGKRVPHFTDENQSQWANIFSSFL